MWNEWTAMRTLNVAAAWESVRSQIVNLMKQFDTKDVVFALSGTENWRKTVLPTYKANRVGVKKPAGYGALREIALAHPLAAMHPKLEADDLLGIRATKPGAKTIIVSSDKDMRTIPGHLYNPTKGTETDDDVDSADCWHLMQTLMGDASDGYKGCPGMGEVKAGKLLSQHTASGKLDRTAAWADITAAYVKAGLCEEEALVQARVARILRYGEFDFSSGEVKLWQPT